MIKLRKLPEIRKQGKHVKKLKILLFSHLVVSDSLQPHGLQHSRLPSPSLSAGVCSNSCPLSQWCHPTISSSVAPFSSFPHSFSASGSFSMSWRFASGHSTEVYLFIFFWSLNMRKLKDQSKWAIIWRVEVIERENRENKVIQKIISDDFLGKHLENQIIILLYNSGTWWRKRKF